MSGTPFDLCRLCGHSSAPPGGRSGGCAYCTDLDREIHEFQFFGHDDTEAWLLDGPKYNQELPPPPPPWEERSAPPASALTADVCSSAGSRPAALAMEQAAGGATTISLLNGYENHHRTGDPTDASTDPTADRAAKIMRYKEKKMRRKYQKQIRYASRKVYAEMRPRIKGRFVKVQDGHSPPPLMSQQPRYDPDALGFRWFTS